MVDIIDYMDKKEVSKFQADQAKKAKLYDDARMQTIIPQSKEKLPYVETGLGIIPRMLSFDAQHKIRSHKGYVLSHVYGDPNIGLIAVYKHPTKTMTKRRSFERLVEKIRLDA